MEERNDQIILRMGGKMTERLGRKEGRTTAGGRNEGRREEQRNES